MAEFRNLSPEGLKLIEEFVDVVQKGIDIIQRFNPHRSLVLALDHLEDAHHRFTAALLHGATEMTKEEAKETVIAKPEIVTPTIN